MGDLTEAELRQLLKDIHGISVSLQDIAIAVTIIKKNSRNKSMRKRFNTDKEIKVKSGRFAGQIFRLEADINEMEGKPITMQELALRGNWAARNALTEDGYTVKDAPFYYGKIGSLGYIISEKDLGINKDTNGK